MTEPPPLSERLLTPAALCLILSPILIVTAYVWLSLLLRDANQRVNQLERSLHECRTDRAPYYEPETYD